MPLLPRLWQRHPRALTATTLVVGALAVGSNPVFLHAVGLILRTQPQPTSGFWLISVICAAFCAVLRWGCRSPRADGAFLLLGSTTLVLLAIDVVLRLAPPVELTEQSRPPVAKTRNAWGYPDTEPRPSAATRILVVGDSITWGVGTTREGARYHDLVEKELREQGRDVDIQAVAAPGWGLDRYLEAYRRVTPEYRPQLVVLGFCLNDLNHGAPARELHDNIEQRGQGGVQQVRNVLGGAARRLRANEWMLATLMQRRVGNLLRDAGVLERDWLDDHQTAYRRYLERWWTDERLLSQLRADLARLHNDVRSAGGQLVVLVFPYRFQLLTGEQRAQDRLGFILDELHVPRLDLTEVFTRAQRERELYAPRDEGHPNDEGHALAARVLLPWLEERLQ
ncbi:MAG: SGNH/GDSL hydrolase family protein [Myxococcota bacterium]